MSVIDFLVKGVPGDRGLLMGNEAIARGAIEGGVQVASAYPGTPSSEILGTLAQVADHFGVDKEVIQSPSKQRNASRARSLLCHLAVNRLMISCVEVAKKLNLSQFAVSKAAFRGRSDSLAVEIEQELLYKR